jgi:Dickkopf-like protein
MPRALVILLLVAAGCGPSSYADFRSQLATEWCARQIRCGEVGGSESQEHCSVAAPLLLTLRGAVDVTASIGAHRMIFHPDNASECIGAVKHAPCDPLQAADDFQRQCHGVVTAGVPNGDACWGDDECVGGVCVAPDCGGVCTPFATVGGACVASGGPPDQSCDPTVQFCGDDAICDIKAQKGKPCSDDSQCIFDFICVAGICNDPPRIARDEVCGTTSPPCADGLYCDETGTCEPLLAAGAACARPDACKTGLVCANAVCAPWLDVGGACNASPDAIASGCPATQTCTGGACAPLAGVKAGPLDKCAVDADCADGLYCVTQGSFCDYVGGINAGCQSDHECAPDLQCLNGACHTPGYVMCAPATAM